MSVTRSDIRRIISEEVERRRLLKEDADWLAGLKTFGKIILSSGTGRQVAAKALKSVASVLRIPDKIDDAVFDAIGTDRASSARQVVDKMNTAANTVGGLLPAALALEALGDMVGNLSDEEAAALGTAATAAAQKIQGGTKG